MIHVVFGVDGYVPQLAVALVSMFTSNVNNEIKTYIVSADLGEADKKMLNESVRGFARELTFLHIDPSNFNKLKVHFHLTHATFYRLFIPEILADLDKILYLDCDIVVEADLMDLWTVDMSGYGNGGVIFPGTDTRDRLGVKDGCDMNAGILIMNLRFWRENDITMRCSRWLASTESPFMDNDAMNVVLNGAQKGVDTRWNLNPIHFGGSCKESDYPSRILHFAGAIKPWHKCYDFQFQELYRKYLALTPWIFDYSPLEAQNISQSISVANQYFERGNFQASCDYYHLAFKFRLAVQKLESEQLMVTINNGIERQNSKDYIGACNFYRAVISFWEFPLVHNINVYQFKDIRA
jgi:lipopolysaccharide biosynthesis glycosyltransferase